MAEPTPTPTPSPTPAPAPSAPPAPAPAAASPTLQNEPSGQVSRPDWLPETLWDDKTKAPKADDLKGIFDRVRADDDRRATLPAKAEDYKAEFKSDFKLPDGWEVDAKNPLWEAGRAFAHQHGLSQEQFSELATVFVQDQVRQRDAVAEAVKQRDASLGPNGGARVEALNTYFRGLFGDQVAAQFAQTLFSKDIIEGFEKVQGALVKQGVTSFSNTGRVEGRQDGRPANWDQMSPIDRRTWDLANKPQQAA